MNKPVKIIVLISTIASILAFTACRSDGPSGVDITGLWSGTIISDDYDNNGETAVFEFFEGGRVKLGEPNGWVIYEEAVGTDFTWSLSENYLVITAWLSMYYAEFYYNLSTDGDTLEIILLQRNFFNDTFDELDCGDRIVLTRNLTDSFADLMVQDSSFYY